MKVSKSVGIYLITFFTLYFVLSAFFCIFYNPGEELNSYTRCVQDPQWFVVYSLFIGWWLALIPAREYYELLEKGE